jgi:hypothetical protein
VLKARHLLQSELQSEVYKDTLRKEILKNIEEGI